MSVVAWVLDYEPNWCRYEPGDLSIAELEDEARRWLDALDLAAEVDPDAYNQLECE